MICLWVSLDELSFSVVAVWGRGSCDRSPWRRDRQRRRWQFPRRQRGGKHRGGRGRRGREDDVGAKGEESRARMGRLHSVLLKSWSHGWLVVVGGHLFPLAKTLLCTSPSSQDSRPSPSDVTCYALSCFSLEALFTNNMRNWINWRIILLLRVCWDMKPRSYPAAAYKYGCIIMWFFLDKLVVLLKCSLMDCNMGHGIMWDMGADG